MLKSQCKFFVSAIIIDSKRQILLRKAESLNDVQYWVLPTKELCDNDTILEQSSSMLQKCGLCIPSVDLSIHSISDGYVDTDGIRRIDIIVSGARQSSSISRKLKSQHRLFPREEVWPMVRDRELPTRLGFNHADVISKYLLNTTCLL